MNELSHREAPSLPVWPYAWSTRTRHRTEGYQLFDGEIVGFWTIWWLACTCTGRVEFNGSVGGVSPAKPPRPEPDLGHLAFQPTPHGMGGRCIARQRHGHHLTWMDWSDEKACPASPRPAGLHIYSSPSCSLAPLLGSTRLAS